RTVGQSAASESESIQLVREVDADPRSTPEPSRTPASDFPGMDVSPTIAMPALEPGSPSSPEGNAAEAAPDDSASADTPADADALPAADADAPTAAGADVQANQRRCVSVGPFPDAAAVTAAVETLRTAGHLPSPRDAEGAAV